ncbi:MAG TPA: class I SAM-dependent methyltransferase [Polyangia bacterium]|nr:class I SAM-dependent methyltransferase [Polyangia bacterium]
MNVRDPFDDAALYDWEYRRRRDDVRFYGTLADERGGPILDLGCGTGRLMLPLLRAGHTVVGVDRGPAMLARAAARLARLSPRARRRALLLRADLRRIPVVQRFAFAVAAFHTIQHLANDRELGDFFAEVARVLQPGGWFAFDTFAPNAQFLARANAARDRRWARTRFRHPTTGRRLEYSESYRLEDRILVSTFHYDPVGRGQRGGAADRRVELAHRLLEPGEIRRLAAGAGLSLIASWGGFDGRPLAPPTEQHVYLLRRGTAQRGRRARGRQKK